MISSVIKYFVCPLPEDFLPGLFLNCVLKGTPVFLSFLFSLLIIETKFIFTLSRNNLLDSQNFKLSKFQAFEIYAETLASKRFEARCTLGELMVNADDILMRNANLFKAVAADSYSYRNIFSLFSSGGLSYLQPALAFYKIVLIARCFAFSETISRFSVFPSFSN